MRTFYQYLSTDGAGWSRLPLPETQPWTAARAPSRTVQGDAGRSHIPRFARGHEFMWGTRRVRRLESGARRPAVTGSRKETFNADLHVRIGSDLQFARICRWSDRKQVAEEPRALGRRGFAQVRSAPAAQVFSGKNRGSHQADGLSALAAETGRLMPGERADRSFRCRASWACSKSRACKSRACRRCARKSRPAVFAGD